MERMARSRVAISSSHKKNCVWYDTFQPQMLFGSTFFFLFYVGWLDAILRLLWWLSLLKAPKFCFSFFSCLVPSKCECACVCRFFCLSQRYGWSTLWSFSPTLRHHCILIHRQTHHTHTDERVVLVNQSSYTRVDVACVCHINVCAHISRTGRTRWMSDSTWECMK